MRRSEILARISTNSPCLFCHLPPESLTKFGKGDAAFLLPTLTREIWETADLTEADRVSLNELFSKLLRCSNNVDDTFAAEAASTKTAVLALTSRTERLRLLCDEFFTLLAE